MLEGSRSKTVTCPVQALAVESMVPRVGFKPTTDRLVICRSVLAELPGRTEPALAAGFCFILPSANPSFRGRGE